VIAVIVTLALIQLFIQLVFFLHLDRGSKPRWNLGILAFAILVVVIIVFGSLWIMANLNYNMTPDQVTKYIMDSEAVSK
jgi:cytochrome o ubiquinol oxidase operon protein cyoD